MNESKVKMFLRGGRRVRPLRLDQEHRRENIVFLLMRKGIYTRQCECYNLTTISVTVTSDRI